MNKKAKLTTIAYPYCITKRVQLLWPIISRLSRTNSLFKQHKQQARQSTR